MEPQNRSTASRPDAGFPGEESGGPGGNGVISTLYQEERLIGKANLDWQADRYNRLRFGGEFTHYAIDYWSTELTSAGLPGRLQGKADPLERVRGRPPRPR